MQLLTLARDFDHGGSAHHPHTVRDEVSKKVSRMQWEFSTVREKLMKNGNHAELEPDVIAFQCSNGHVFLREREMEHAVQEP